MYLTGYNYGPGDASTLYINGASNLTITNIEVNENTSGGGSSAIVITGGSSVSFTGGSSNCNPAAASVAGGGANVEGNGNVVSFTDFTFSGNSKDIQGGSGLYISGDNTTTVTVTDCIIADNENRSASGGAAIFIAGANLIMSGTCINDNVVELGSGPKYGGAISVGRGATLTISDCSFSGNSITNSGKGGAISINTSFAGSGSAASVSLNSCSFTGNSASSEGNHIYLRVGSSNPASFTIDECTFSATAQDIRQDNSGIVSIQNSGTPVTSGTGITFTNTTPPATTPNTSCPTLVGPCYSVLPVELAGFTTECTNGSISIEWTTISERDNDYFIIERAGKGLIFESIDIISGIGNSQSIQHYSTTDNLPNSAIHYYRLIQVDKNGSRHIYETTSVLPCTNNNEVKVYFEGSNTLFFNSTSIELSSVQLTDLSGKLVSLENFSISVKEGIIHLDNIGSGVYLFIARTTFGEMITTRIYKQ